MGKYGIICNEEYKEHCTFHNYRLALYNYFGIDQFKNIKSVADIVDITHLFIVDEHFGPNLAIWSQPDFIKNINDKNIKVIIFNTEKIFIPCFPWNVETQRKVESFKNYHQFMSDSIEAEQYNKQVINKFMLSKSTDLGVTKIDNKMNKILFAGQMEGPQYDSRRNIISQINNLKLDIPLEVFNTKRKLSYNEFLNLTNKYKYILCPLGTGRFFSLRHFEAIRLGCIPIQEIVPQMDKWYKDEYKNCITFNNVNEIRDNITNFIPSNIEIYLEDLFDKINIRNYI